MKRTNIVLEEAQYQYLKDRAERERKSKSISAIVRELIEAAMRPSQESIKDDSIFKIVGMAKGKGRDIARRNDEILYRKDW